jgi:hypothetical protein
VYHGTWAHLNVLIKKSLPSVCVSVCVSLATIVARQRLSRNVTAVTNAHATIEELLDTSFSMRSVSYQGKWAISSSENFLFVLESCSVWMSAVVAEILCRMPVTQGYCRDIASKQTRTLSFHIPTYSPFMSTLRHHLTVCNLSSRNVVDSKTCRYIRALHSHISRLLMWP